MCYDNVNGTGIGSSPDATGSSRIGNTGQSYGSKTMDRSAIEVKITRVKIRINNSLSY